MPGSCLLVARVFELTSTLKQQQYECRPLPVVENMTCIQQVRANVCACVAVSFYYRFIRKPTGVNVSLSISYEVPEVLAPFANVSPAQSAQG